MLEGIKYAVESSKTEKELEAEFNKKQGESADYLAKDREYRSELDVFDENAERDAMFPNGEDE